MPAQLTARRAALAALTIGALGACGEARAPAEPPIDYHTSMQRASFRATPLTDQAASVPPAQAAAIDVITGSVLKSGTDLFRKPGVAERLDAIEDAFLATGRYFALVSLYKRDVDALGTATPAAPRYAWALIRLGQSDEATAMIDRLEADRPGDAIGPFLRGSMAMATAKDDPERAGEVIAEWGRALALDAKFVGPERVDAAAMRREIDALRAQHPTLKAAPAAPPTAALLDPLEAAAQGTQIAHLSAPDEPGALPDENAPAPETTAAAAPDAQTLAPAGAPEAERAAAPAPPASIAVLIGQARAALARGERAEATALTRRALEIASPAGVEGLAASDALGAVEKIDLLKLSVTLGVSTRSAGAALATIARAPELSSERRFECALVALRSFKDPALAASILDALEAKDAAGAARLPIDALRREIDAR